MLYKFNICPEDMEVDPIPASDVQNPPDIDSTRENTEVEADLVVRLNNLSSTTDIGDITSTGKL